MSTISQLRAPAMARLGACPLARALSGFFLGLTLVGCSSSDVQPCGEIPADGCPLGRGGTCDDEFCAALYDCVQGSWQRVQTCGNSVSGTGGAGGRGVGGAGTAGGGGCANAEIDHSGEVTNCFPDPQVPDCPVSAAESCQPCVTGCLDFFLCTQSGWQLVAHCDANGQVVVDQ